MLLNYLAGIKQNLRLSIVVSIILVILLTCTGQAVVPYDSYIYNFWQAPVPAPQAYVFEAVVYGTDLGVGELVNPSDIFVGPNHHIYILDTGNNRVIHCDQNWNLIEVITGFEHNGRIEGFKNPRGLYVSPQNHVFVADTDNERIVQLTPDGELVRIIGRPTSDHPGMIPDTFRYRPIAFVVDRANRVIVVSEGQNEGLLELELDGTFRGFLGAPRVTPSVADIFWYRVATDEQRQKLALFVPTEFVDVALDPDGMLLATIATGANVSYRQTPIRRLSPAGVDVMRRLGFTTPRGDITGLSTPSRFVNILPRSNGVYSALDAQRGRIFTYDADGHLLYVFGGLGEQKGTFRRPVAMAELNGRILVLDAGMNSISIFQPTEYAGLIHAALEAYDRGLYDLASEKWQAVLRLNANYDRAYTGIGRSHLMNRQLEAAMHYLKLGNNRTDYSKAFNFYRRDIVTEHFGTIMTIIFIAIGLWAGYGRYRRSKQKPDYALAAAVEVAEDRGFVCKHLIATTAALKYGLYLIFHPYKAFWDLKHERRGNMAAASIILILACISYIFVRQYTGFIFNARDLSRLNIYRETASLLLPFGLWVVINWSITTLMEGKGTLKDVYIASGYALLPLFLLNIPATLVSNLIIAEESYYYYLLLSGGIVWTVVLLLVGTQVTHEYSMAKTIYTALLTVVGIFIMLFIGIFFFVLVDQLISFVVGIEKEISLRL